MTVKKVGVHTIEVRHDSLSDVAASFCQYSDDLSGGRVVTTWVDDHRTASLLLSVGC